MNWGSLSEFLAMGGYGLYVWGSYVVVALFMASEVWLVRKRKRTLLQRLSRTRRSFNEEINETEA